MKPLKRCNKISRKGPAVLLIMDGVGLGREDAGNAFFNARTPTLNRLMDTCPFIKLKAHGTAVGLPSDDDMGNSEVGHNAMGAGRVFAQGAKLVNEAIADKSIFTSALWKELTAAPARGDACFHFIGLLSDGNVHSHIDQLKALLAGCVASGVKKCRLHVLLDGRDVPETSALKYIDDIEAFLAECSSEGLDYRIASGGGRMTTTMDRYMADWQIVKRGWDAHVLGKARHFASAREAVETFRKESAGITDQYLPSFTIAEAGQPIGTINDGDSVVLFNFRGDRAIEISRAFDEGKDFTFFDRERVPKTLYAGMMEYDGDLHIPKRYLVTPPNIEETVSEYIAASGVRQFAVSETQKFGHVTYFWNGNRSGKFNDELEDYVEIPSDKIEFNLKPWMKAGEITDAAIEAIVSGNYGFIRLNFPNGDMVGHTGDFNAAVVAAQVVDICVERIINAVKEAGGVALITADHGNLDEMFETDKTGGIKINKVTGEPEPKTSHTLNPVPAIIYDPQFSGEYSLTDTNAGISSIAATLLMLMDFEPPANYDAPFIKRRS